MDENFENLKTEDLIKLKKKLIGKFLKKFHNVEEFKTKKYKNEFEMLKKNISKISTIIIMRSIDGELKKLKELKNEKRR